MLEREREAEVRNRRNEQMRIYGDDPERLDDAEDDGDQGILFGSRRFFSRDARMACRILSCGTVPEERQLQILKHADEIADECGEARKVRDYCSAMNIKLRAAALELEYAKVVRSSLMMRPVPNPNADDVEPEHLSLSYLEQPNLSDQAETAALMEQYGLVRIKEPDDDTTLE
jgi:hypothetical protein